MPAASPPWCEGRGTRKRWGSSGSGQTAHGLSQSLQTATMKTALGPGRRQPAKGLHQPPTELLLDPDPDVSECCQARPLKRPHLQLDVSMTRKMVKEVGGGVSPKTA